MSLRDSIRSNLQEYTVLAKQLIDSLGVVGGMKSEEGLTATPEQVLAKIISKDRELQSHVDELIEHQEFQRRLQESELVEKSLDMQITALVNQLHAAEVSLQAIVDSSYSKTASLRNPPIPFHQLISFSRKISYTTSAPPGFTPGQPLTSFRPPAPIDVDLQKGMLYSPLPQDIKDYLGIKDDTSPSNVHSTPSNITTPTVTTTSTNDDNIEWEETTPSNSTTISSSTSAPSTSSSTTTSKPIVIPPIPKNWKPGMPINISLPPIPSATTTISAATPSTLPPAPPIKPPPTNKTTSGRIDLDLNLDLEEEQEDVEWE